MKRFIFFASLLGCFFLFGSVVTAQTFQISSADQNFVGTPGSTVPFSATFSIEQVSGVTQEMCGFQFHLHPVARVVVNKHKHRRREGSLQQMLGWMLGFGT